MHPNFLFCQTFGQRVKQNKLKIARERSCIRTRGGDVVHFVPFQTLAANIPLYLDILILQRLLRVGRRA